LEDSAKQKEFQQKFYIKLLSKEDKLAKSKKHQKDAVKQDVVLGLKNVLIQNAKF